MKRDTMNDTEVTMLKYPDTALVILYSRKKYDKKTFQLPVVNFC